jgi:hypothetical protein
MTLEPLMDLYTKYDIESSFHRGDELLGCEIFTAAQSQNPLLRSALTEMLILVRDLMAKTKIYATPVEFVDDINITQKVRNVSDAIKFVRDAICYVNSDNRNHVECKARLSYNVIYGKAILAKIGDVEIKSDYEDDVCIIFGDQKLYLRRHIIRAYEEARSKLMSVIQT